MAEQLEFQKLSVIRFWERVDKSGGKDACWEWKIAKDRGGYGAWTFEQKQYKAHRMAYQYTYGRIPKGTLVCHRCDNPPCCNPSHLFTGTSNDNRQDAVNKKRHAFGERNGRAKLKEYQVKEIIELLKAGNISQPELARRYGCTNVIISKINVNMLWKHLPR